MPVQLTPTLREALAGTSRPLAGIWVCSGSPLVAEIVAGSGIDWLLIDQEHGPSQLESTLRQLQAVAAYPVTPVVRVPSDDPVTIKQVLDLGAQNLLVPMVSSAAQARDVVRAVRYPPRGMRGVGSALARSARWNRVEDYLMNTDRYVSLFVQIETVDGVEAAAEIAATDGVDGVFVGPSDLAASIGLIGQQTHSDVTAAVRRAFEAVRSAGKPVGVNAFDPAVAQSYLDAGATFVLVGADVALLARSTEALAARYVPATNRDARPSY
ncbi:HpcH/HpaI aldolase family protein [Georgenia yuyongxinii]|uniref:HpcH/HpaI aldolase/citrate lyase family protein n=1 Tax=Georgenia yuyongxinii TaxID=2589797 RepID=A0A552WWN5_9MICO|nr:HpcH/HpaI aldolase/citrate lyase family protein [Georgenia yuyongxinii]TRW46999.1 HpcH/HpaI aldolase/citrate lyase family protein [Georgenia yuyongxinii]